MIRKPLVATDAIPANVSIALRVFRDRCTSEMIVARHLSYAKSLGLGNQAFLDAAREGVTRGYFEAVDADQLSFKLTQKGRSLI